MYIRRKPVILYFWLIKYVDGELISNEQNIIPPSTRMYLEDYFGNCVSITRYRFFSNRKLSQEQLTTFQQRFIAGMKQVAQSKLPIKDDIGPDQLLHIADIATGDWGNIETIRALYIEFYRLLNEDFDEKELFSNVH